MGGGKSPLDVEGCSAERAMGNLKDNHVKDNHVIHQGMESYAKQWAGDCHKCPHYPTEQWFIQVWWAGNGTIHQPGAQLNGFTIMKLTGSYLWL